jgi:serine phosphatase RsbU (regulator of sigma subunit)
VVKHWAGNTLVGIIDGLGHGEPAHIAAVAARNFVESHYDQPLDALFRGTAFACQGTRGCVMALARFDWERETITFASVGNIEARVIGSSVPVSFMLRRGIVGLNTPLAHVSEHTWEPENMLVLYSDGITTHWNWQDFPQLVGKPASLIAQGMLRTLAKSADDATILIVKTTTRI